MTSNWDASRKTSSMRRTWWGRVSRQFSSCQRACGQGATSFAAVRESPLANRVTSCPSRTSSSVKYETTLSVPPYWRGGTLSYKGATWAMRIVDSLASGRRPTVRVLLLVVVDPYLRERVAAVLEVADFHERRPQLDRGLDEADDVVDDAEEILLEEVWLEAVKDLLEVGREEPQGTGALRAPLQVGGPRGPAVERHDLGQDLIRVPRRHLTVVVERDGQLVQSRHGRLDFPFQQIGHFFVEDLRGGWVTHVIALAVVLGGVHVRGDQARLLDPQPVDVVLEPPGAWGRTGAARMYCHTPIRHSPS